METIDMKCPHCGHIIESLHSQKGCKYEYSKEPPKKDINGLSTRITCTSPKCRKEFYSIVITITENTE